MARPVPRISVNRHGTPPSHLTASQRTRIATPNSRKIATRRRAEWSVPDGDASMRATDRVDRGRRSIGPAVAMG